MTAEEAVVEALVGCDCIEGRDRVQCVTYLASQKCGINLGHGANYYRPYSREVSEALDRLTDDGTVDMLIHKRKVTYQVTNRHRAMTRLQIAFRRWCWIAFNASRGNETALRLACCVHFKTEGSSPMSWEDAIRVVWGRTDDSETRQTALEVLIAIGMIDAGRSLS